MFLLFLLLQKEFANISISLKKSNSNFNLVFNRFYPIKEALSFREEPHSELQNQLESKHFSLKIQF